mmetsp:Transcript_7965/g.17737  ORF Transcript_7965/g.17737 Transcript_7965/m.17737 type:complete len:372 (+) Transcript_7965:34-1149(+)
MSKPWVSLSLGLAVGTSCFGLWWLSRRRRRQLHCGASLAGPERAWARESKKVWAKLGEAPWAKRHDFSAAAFRGGVIVVGGYSGRRHNDCWWSTDGCQWNCVSAEEAAPWARRMKHSVIASSQGVYVLGGEGAAWKALNDVWYLSAVDTDGWKQVSQAAPWAPRCSFAAVLREGKDVENQEQVIVLGGAAGRNVLDTLWTGSPQQLGLKKSAASKAPWGARRGQAAVALPNAHVLVMGGRNGTGAPLNDVWWSCDGERWVQLSDAPWPPRCSTAVACIPQPDGSAVLLLCGGLGAGGTLLGDTWSLRVDAPFSEEAFQKARWNCECETSPWNARAGHAMAWAADASLVLLMGGVTVSGTPLNDVWAWTSAR